MAISSIKSLFGRFRAGETLGHRGERFALCHHLFLERVEITTQLGEFFGCGGSFRFGVGARAEGLSVLAARLVDSLTSGFGFCVQPGNLLLLGRKLLFHAAMFGAGLIARVRRAYE